MLKLDEEKLLPFFNAIALNERVTDAETQQTYSV